MKLTVPYIYEAMIIKPRCRKPSLAVVRDSVEVEIKEVDPASLPVAFKIGSTKIRWDGEQLWDFDYHTVSRQAPEKVLASAVRKNTESPDGYAYSCSGAMAPFNNFWDGMNDTMCQRHDTRYHGFHRTLNDDSVVSKEDLVYREWFDDNKTSVEALAKEIASELLICDGYMYTTTNEPRYVVQTFGLGGNHGGTGLFIAQGYNTNIGKDAYFTALEYDKARAYADRVAANRGDDKSLPVTVSKGVAIEVLIPEAVQLKPKEEHGDGDAFINSIESGIQSMGPIGGMMVMGQQLSGHG